jgi:hypothetical protein
MATRKELYDKMVEDREREAVEADAVNRRARLLTVAACLAWCALGAAILAWGLMSHDVENGRVALKASWQVAAAGALLTLLYAHVRAERRGDR